MNQYSLLRFGSEVLFRASVVSFSRHFWKLRLRRGSVIPEGPCFLYGNHSNNYDPFMINAFTDWGKSTAGVMTIEYLQRHPLAPLFKQLGILGTRKSQPEPHLIRSIFRLLDQGRSFVIYPEGGRRWDGRPAPWIESTAHLFARAGVPVYPIITHGSYVGWPRWARYPRPARIELEVLSPITFERDCSREDALERLKAPIDIDENVCSPEHRPVRAFHPATGIEKLLYRNPVNGLSGDLFTPDGLRVESRSGTERWKMLPDSRLEDSRTGEIDLTGDLYRKIRDLPQKSDGDGMLLTNRAAVRGQLRTGSHISAVRSTISLFSSHLLIEERDRYHVPLESVRYVRTEQNDKFVLALSGGELEFHLRYGGSALQWHDEMLRTAPLIQP